jgi:hypothetical protein
VLVLGLFALAACAEPFDASLDEPEPGEPRVEQGSRAALPPQVTTAAASRPVVVPDVFAQALRGATCAPRACTASECGLVDDGCRAERWCGECSCAATAMACERSATQIWEHIITVPGTYTITATVISPSTIDPVLHVIDAAGNEYAYDDNSAGGTLPRVTITVPSGQQRLVVMRPKADSPTGAVATVQINGLSYIFGVRGRRQIFSGLRATEELEAVQLPPSTSTHTIYAMSADGEHIQGRVSGNGTAGGAVFTQAAAASSRVFWHGTSNPAAQPTRLLRNDRRLSLHDVDNDGLGSELEAALGTCAALTGFAFGKDGVAFSCADAVDARDTDGDGLSDGIEVRGARTTTPHQPLPRWGANPRHKDLFAELDGARLTATDTPPKMSAAQARLFSDFYGDRARDLSPAERATHAATLRNPDGLPGIRTHLDIGLPAETAADATVYGDWGGYNFVPPAASGGGAYPGDAWRTHLAASRVAMFRYALIWNGGGGQTSTSDTCPGCGSYAWGSSNEGGAALSDTLAHESGHANAIAHSGPAGVHPEVDPNCKPNWPSIMNYAFAGAFTGFADGTGMGTVNNARATEWNAVNPALTGVVSVLRDAFKYRVDPAGHVDWNRDGAFAPAGSTVRAYINNQPGHGGCEFTRYNSQQLTTQMSSKLSPALARLGPQLFAFAAGQNRLRYVWSTSAFNCPVGTAACGTWQGYATTPLDVTRGVDATRVTDGQGHQALLVVGVDATGMVNSSMLVVDAFGATQWTPVQWTGIWGTTTGEPAVEVLPDGRALLIFRRDNGDVLFGVYQYEGGTAGSWVRWGAATTCDTTIPLRQKATASPGLARVAINGIGPRVWALINEPTTSFTLKSFDAARLCFVDAEVPLTSSWDPAGRPVGVWVPDASNALGGKLHILGLDFNSDPIYRHLTQLWSYVDASDGQAKIGLASGFDSIWARGYGIDAWHDPVDGNLRALYSMSPTLGAGDGQPIFYPRADGINDFDQLNYNDWTVLRYAVCRNVVNPTGSVSSPISCPPRPW